MKSIKGSLSFLAIILSSATIWSQVSAKSDDVTGVEHNNEAVRLIELKKYDQAIELLKATVKLRPDDATAYYNLGCTYIRQGNFKAAVLPLERARKLSPGNTEIRVNLGYAYACRGRFAEAIAEIKVAVKLRPDDIQAASLLANYYALAKDRTSALAVYENIKSRDAAAARILRDVIYSDKVVSYR